MKPRGSFETIDKGSTAQEKTKDDKKRKEKKPGMLSGLFKRKDKKNKSTDDEFEDLTSPTESSFRASPQPKVSLESLEQRTSKPQRDTSKKLQKQQPTTSMSPSPGAELTRNTEPDQSIRQVTAPTTGSFEESRGIVTSPTNQPSSMHESFTTPVEPRGMQDSPVDRPSSEAQWRGPYNSERATPQPSVASPPEKFVPKLGTSYAENSERESPVNVSPVEEHIPISAPGLTPDSTQRAQSVSPISPPSSPEADTNYVKGSGVTPGSVDTLSVDTPSWSDASLRSYLDDENDIRDLFIIVHDRSNIPPAGSDHPVTGRLFKEESKRLKEMNNQLDEMLVNWMSQRTSQRTSAMRSAKTPTA